MRRNNMQAWRMLLMVLFVPASLAAQQRHEFTSRQCADYAMKNSSDVKNALLGIQIQEQVNREYTSAAYPRIGGSIGVNYNPKIAIQTFPNFIAAGTYGVLEAEGVKDGNGNPITAPSDFGLVQAQFGTRYTAQAFIELNQLLFDGQVFVGLQARSTALAFAQKSAEVTEVNIRANIFKIYYQLVASRRQVASLDASIERFEKLLHDTRELHKNGFAEKLDVDKVNVTLINLRTERQKLLQTIDSGYLGLKLLMGMPVKEELILTDTLPEASLKMDMLEESYNPEDRKELQQLQIAQKLGEYNIKRYKLSKIPTISLFGNYSENAQRNNFDIFDFDQDWLPASLVGVRINYSIFEGFGRNARIQKAKIELEQTKNRTDQMKLAIDNDVEQARIRFKNAVITLDYQKTNMELAENVYNQTKKKYEQGLGSNLEITTSQTELRTAQTNYFSALYDAIVARVDYLKAIGKL